METLGIDNIGEEGIGRRVSFSEIDNVQGRGETGKQICIQRKIENIYRYIERIK